MGDEASLNWLLRIAYDGTEYKGYQLQKPGVKTIQGMLEYRLERLYGRAIPTYGMSRTDAGVHALDQRVTIIVPPVPAIPVPSVRLALNHALPADIRLLSIDAQEPGFHARHDAVGKAYTYLIYRGVTTSPFLSRYSWHVFAPLEVEPMREAAQTLIGTHDFTAFSANTRTGESPHPIKTLHAIEVAEHGPVLRVTVIGNSFLYRMMRRIAGYLVSVGRGRLPASRTAAILAARDRRELCETAPPNGLFLDRAFFCETEMLTYRRTELPILDLVNL